MDLIDRQAAINAIHNSIFDLMDTFRINIDGEEIMSDSDRLLLKANKAICNSVKELPAYTPEGGKE